MKIMFGIMLKLVLKMITWNIIVFGYVIGERSFILNNILFMKILCN